MQIVTSIIMPTIIIICLLLCPLFMLMLMHTIIKMIICNIWLQIDVLLCTASIWGLTMISIDRYIATNHPIKYRIHKNNPKIGIAYISTAWLISFLISLGPLFFYKIETNDTFNKTKVSKRSSLKQINNTNNKHTTI